MPAGNMEARVSSFELPELSTQYHRLELFRARQSFGAAETAAFSGSQFSRPERDEPAVLPAQGEQRLPLIFNIQRGNALEGSFVGKSTGHSFIGLALMGFVWWSGVPYGPLYTKRIDPSLRKQPRRL